MPVSNNTVFPSNSSTSRQRHASSMRLSASGGVHFSHTARGALPYIAPPSSRWRLPSTDASRTPGLLVERARRAELQLREPRIQRAALQELRVGAARDDAAVVDDDGAVGFEHGGEPVRDYNRRAVLHQALERLLHRELARGVERARGLVEQQD